MRIAYLLITLTLIGALAAPFYLKGPAGQPLMTWDKVVEDNTPEVLINREAYRWQDADGRWHFSDQAGGADAQRFEIEHNMTTMESKWIAEAQAAHAGQAPGTGGAFQDMLKGTQLSIPEAYQGQALDKANAAAGLLEERSQMLDRIMQDLGADAER